MDKNETLEKERAAKEKERERQIEKDSYRFSWVGVTIMLTILMIFRIYMNEPVADLALLVATQIATGAFYQFMKLKSAYHLFTLILACGAIILNLFALLSQYGMY